MSGYDANLILNTSICQYFYDVITPPPGDRMPCVLLTEHISDNFDNHHFLSMS